MPGETDILYEALRESQSRLTYYLLTAAAAAIALTVNQTRDAKLQWSQVPLGIAALLWGVSFLFGCLQRQYVNSTLFANLTLLRVLQGREPRLSSLEGITAAERGIKEALDYNSRRANIYAVAQFFLLIIGAVFFLTWHIYSMYLRRSGAL
ncbi:MAG: hypothetical protein ABSG46_04670 [Candidatus Binataceae bacterium]|jgi:hypothetical protein